MRVRRQLANTVLCASIAMTCGALLAPTQVHAADDALFIYSAGIDAMMPDERDAALRQALHMLGPRILELPAELDEPNMPAPVIQLVMDMLMSPMHLRAGMVDEPANSNLPPIYAQLAFPSDGALAERRHRQVTDFMRMADMDIDDVLVKDGPLRTLDLDGMPGYIGTATIGDQPAFLMAIHETRLDAPELTSFGLPEGATPVFAIHIDGEELQPILQMIASQAPPDAAPMIQMQMAMYGLDGDNPASFTGAWGIDNKVSHGVFRYGNYASNPLYASMLAKQSLTNNDLRLIPQDATMFQAWRFNAAELGNSINMWVQQMLGSIPEDEIDAPPAFIEDPIQAIADQTGIHLQDDIFAHLGENGGWYISESTGGGGLASLVVYQQVTDEAALNQTKDKIVKLVNDMGSDMANGYVRIGERTIDGHTFQTLMFPGLPIPLEICTAVSDGYKFFALNPQALLAAIEQAKSKRSIVNNGAFRRAMQQVAGTQMPDDLMSITYTDTAALLADGYSLTSFGMAALSNAVRSPSDESRDPGIVMPGYAALARSATPSIVVTRVEAGDLVQTMQFDRSMLANLTAGVGAIGNSYAAIGAVALGGGIMLPALGKARDQAKLAKSQSQLRMLAQAGMVYAMEHDDEAPQSFEALIKGEYMTRDMLASPLGSVWDEEGDYWLNTTFDHLSKLQNPSRTVWAYDRASCIHGDKVLVLFYDGHVELMYYWEFADLTQEQQHQGIDFNMP
jgi:prepilin-type processing-associated H-X9-DG protein